MSDDITIDPERLARIRAVADDATSGGRTEPNADELARRRRSPQTSAPAPSSRAGYGPGGGYLLSEMGNARRFVDANRDRFRYVRPWKTWLAWDGQRWKRDTTGEAERSAKETVAGIYADSARVAQRAADATLANGSDGLVEVTAESAVVSRGAEAIGKHARASDKCSAMGSMLALASTEAELAADTSAWNADRDALNVANGTLALRTGELHPHAPGDMITLLAPVAYDAGAPSPTWEAFLARVLPNTETRAWIQRYLGYALTGHVGEQCLAFFIGGGANGKSVMLDVVLELLGDYGLRAAPDLVVASHNDRHPTELADLDGKRLVVCSEIEQGRSFAESTIKRITGDATISARRMHADFYTFAATHKLLVAANTYPNVRGTDDGIWRRMRLVPWTVQIPEAERDKTLAARLIADEGPGILAWLVRGCLDWHANGLGTCDEIERATSHYRADEDVLGRWIEDRCDLGAELWHATVSLYQSYTSWCEEEGLDSWTRATWRKRMIERRGIHDGKRGPRSDVRALIGIAVRGLP